VHRAGVGPVVLARAVWTEPDQRVGDLDAGFDEEQTARLRADPAAWEWFSTQTASYRRSATHWVVSAKRPETRQRRLDQLIADSAAGRKVPPLVPG